MTLHIGLLQSIFRYLGWRSPAVALLMISVSLTEGLSVALLLPLLSRVGIAYGAGQGIAGTIINRLVAVLGFVGTFSVLAILILVAAAQAVLFIALQWMMSRTARSYQRLCQSQLFRSLMHAQWEFVAKQKAGELTNTIVSDTERVAQAFYIGLYLIATSISACVYLIFALIVAWPITLGLMVCAVVMTLAVLQLYRENYAAGRTIPPLNAQLQSILSEHISGFKIVKATASEEAAATYLDQIVHRLQRTNAKIDFMPGFVRGLLEFLSFSALAMIFVLGQSQFGVAPGNIIVVFALFMRLFPRITTVQSYLLMLNGLLHSVNVVDELRAAAASHAERNGHDPGALSVQLPTSLALCQVDVKLGEREILHQLDLMLPVPGIVGVVGSSGAGKSTLVHTILGLVMPLKGNIVLGDHNLASEPLGAWRRAIGYVPQETILFHTSVRENLMITNPGATATEVECAAKRAHAHDFINLLPQGYDTIIGDQGVKLSGGQRQRLGIARALLGKPKILLLDEAMSALDAKSEVELLRTLEKLRTEMGIMVVAHRLASLRTADAIYFLDSGRVVESGTWDELMARRAQFFAMAEAQSVGSRDAAAILA